MIRGSLIWMTSMFRKSFIQFLFYAIVVHQCFRQIDKFYPKLLLAVNFSVMTSYREFKVQFRYALELTTGRIPKKKVIIDLNRADAK